MDSETNKILSEQRLLAEITNHQGWSVVRRIYSEKILDLQNAFNIDASDPQKMIIDLQARKLATTILFDFLREIEGASAVVEENKPKYKHIVNLED